MLTSDDLAAYLGRIGYTGRRAPILDTLRRLVMAHATAIPFENIDVLLGRGARIDAASLVAKMVRRGRGGYCFEHNLLFREVLEALGFAVEGLAARVLWRRPEGDPGPRTHMLLRVRLPEGVFLADVGFGGLTLTAPLKFEFGPEQATPHEPHRLVAADGETELQVRLDGGWVRLYRFTDTPQLPIDYEVANWFTATYPAGLFTNHLMLARPEPDGGRCAMFDRDFTIRHPGRPAERRELAGSAELAEVMRRRFVLDLPEADVEAVWERISR